MNQGEKYVRLDIWLDIKRPKHKWLFSKSRYGAEMTPIISEVNTETWTHCLHLSVPVLSVSLCWVYQRCVRGGGDGDGGADMEVDTEWLGVHADWSSVCSHDAVSEANRPRRGSYCSQRNKTSLGSKCTNHLETKTQKSQTSFLDWTRISAARISLGFKEKLGDIQCGMPTCWFSGGGSRKFLGWLL